MRAADRSKKKPGAFPDALVARGMAYGDFDRDGDLDVLIATNHSAAHLYRNDGGNANHWLNVKLEGTRANRDGIGAVVRVTSAGGTQWQAVHSGSSYLSANDLALTFGLGRDEKATSVEVQWPGGGKQVLKDVPAGQHLGHQTGMTDLLASSGTVQARLIRNGEISSAELVDAHLQRIDEVNPTLNAVVEVLAEEARHAARRIDEQHAQGAVLGPLAGVPFSVKDSIEVEGTVCTAGTLGLQSASPSVRDATVVARLRAAGAIPIARTNLPDLLFAFESDNLIHGRTNNPYDLARTSGGSSGGEAALIAACGSPFGLGSDAAGSVRLPAHYCGIASIKPTSGRLPRTGHVPPAGGWIETLWQIGPMARRVEDLCTVMPLLAYPGRRGSYGHRHAV